jgi:hypothetical protein
MPASVCQPESTEEAYCIHKLILNPFDHEAGALGVVTTLADDDIATYCGGWLVHTPTMFMRVFVTDPVGLKTRHDPGGALPAVEFPLKTPRDHSDARTIDIMRMAQP